MLINLSPFRADETLRLARQNDALIVNGETFDFAPLAEGATLPADAIDSAWFVGPVTRLGGALQITLAVPHGPNAPHETRFPDPIVNPPNGDVALPIHSVEEPEDAAD